MSDTIGKWYTHCHHSGEWFEMLNEPEEVRVAHIKEHKPADEIETRLRLFKPLKGALPVEVTDARKAYDDVLSRRADAWKAYDDAWRAYADARKAYDDARKAYADARKAYDDAWTAWDDAWKAWDDARKAWDDVLSRHADELNALHLAECGPDCPWTPENRTIFPKATMWHAR